MYDNIILEETGAMFPPETIFVPRTYIRNLTVYCTHSRWNNPSLWSRIQVWITARFNSKGKT